MKKILLATSALVASAGFAAADIDISGSAQMGLEYDDSAASGEEITQNNEVAVTFAMSGETDSGLAFGATTVHKVSQNAGAVDNDDTWVWISGAWGKLSMGAVTEADRLIGLGDLGLDGLGTDDIAEAFSGSNVAGGGHNTNYTYSNGGLTLALSANVGNANDPMAVGVKYDAGSFAAAIGYNDNGAGEDATSLGLTTNFGDVSLAALYTDNSVDGDAMGVTASFTTGAATITAAYSDNDDATDASYGIGVAYDLGGGATLKGGFADIDGTTVADLGVSMSF